MPVSDATHMGRRTKTLLLTLNELLQPKTIHPKAVQSELTKRKGRQKYCYNKLTKLLRDFQKGSKLC